MSVCATVHVRPAVRGVGDDAVVGVGVADCDVLAAAEGYALPVAAGDLAELPRASVGGGDAAVGADTDKVVVAPGHAEDVARGQVGEHDVREKRLGVAGGVGGAVPA